MNLFKRSFSKGFTQARLIFSVGLVTLMLVFGIISYDHQIGTVTADTQPNMSGWAWSDNIGWISFSYLNGMPGPQYGVSVAGPLDTGHLTGLLSGYAWSDNIGWISFSCATGGDCFTGSGDTYPTGGGTQPVPAQITDNIMKGWVRACSVFAPNPDGLTKCKGTLKSDDARGGWDGWISLSGENPHYGVVYIPNNVAPGTGTFGSFTDPTKTFAWGDTNLGWISFQPRNPADHQECGLDPSKCGVILGQPPLSANCTVWDDGQASPHATWTAIASGGRGGWTYKWTFTGTTGASCSPSSDSTFLGDTNATKTNQCSLSGGATSGTVEGFVTVSDGSPTPAVSLKCASTAHSGTGVRVSVPVAGYTISATTPVSAIFQNGQIATTTPPSKITITPSISPQYNSPVTLTASIDPLDLANSNLGINDVVYQYSYNTGVFNPNTWTFQQTPITVTPSGGQYAPVSLLIKFTKRPSSPSIPVTISGNAGDGRTTTLTINIDKGTSGVQEQ